MMGNTIRVIAFGFLLFAACKTIDKTTEKGSNVALTVLDGGYFLKNNVVLQDNLSCMVVTQQPMLDNNFGYGAVMGANHTLPDFSKEMVLAVVAKPSNIEMKLSFKNALLVADDLQVYILANSGSDLGYEASSVALASIQRNENIRSVSFYNGKTLIRKVEL